MCFGQHMAFDWFWREYEYKHILHKYLVFKFAIGIPQALAGVGKFCTFRD